MKLKSFTSALLCVTLLSNMVTEKSHSTVHHHHHHDSWILSKLESIGAATVSAAGLELRDPKDDTTGRVPKTWVTEFLFSYDITTLAKFLPFGLFMISDERARSNAGENIDNLVLLVLQWGRYIELALGPTKTRSRNHQRPRNDWLDEVSYHTKAVCNSTIHAANSLLKGKGFSDSTQLFQQHFANASSNIEGFAIVNKIGQDSCFALTRPLDPKIPQLILDHRKSLTVFSPLFKQVTRGNLDLKKLTNNWMAVIGVPDFALDFKQAYLQASLDRWLSFYHSMKRSGFNKNTFEELSRFSERLLNPIFILNQEFISYQSTEWLIKRASFVPPELRSSIALTTLATPVLKKTVDWAVDALPESASKDMFQNDPIAWWLPYIASAASSLYTFKQLAGTPLIQTPVEKLKRYSNSGSNYALYGMFAIGFSGSMLSMHQSISSGIENGLATLAPSFSGDTENNWIYYASQSISAISLLTGIYVHDRLLKANPIDTAKGKTLRNGLSMMLAGHVCLDYVVKFWPVISSIGSDIKDFFFSEASKAAHEVVDRIGEHSEEEAKKEDLSEEEARKDDL